MTEVNTNDESGPGKAAAGPAAAVPEAAGGTRRRRFRWRTEHYSPEEQARARQQWRDAMPWQHPMSRGDKGLVLAVAGVLLLTAATMPLRPFLLASHPVALSAVTGSLSAIGAGAAFARVGEGALWLVIAAGVFGMIKFDWLFWLAGRQWGAKIIELWAPGEASKRFVARVRSWPRWAMPLVVAAAALPGIPAPAVYALAGLGRMRLLTFLVFDAIGAAAVAGLVAGLGYGVGQHAVDVVLMIDEYALWITLALVAVVTVQSVRRSLREERERKARQQSADHAPESAG